MFTAAGCRSSKTIESPDYQRGSNRLGLRLKPESDLVETLRNQWLTDYSITRHRPACPWYYELGRKPCGHFRLLSLPMRADLILPIAVLRGNRRFRVLLIHLIVAA
jgi:hypothetical protein